MYIGPKILYANGDRVHVTDPDYGIMSGTVCGLACSDITDIYVIELDTPVDEMLRITAFYSEMEMIFDEETS